MVLAAFGAPLTAAAPPELRRLYDGGPRPPADVARLFVSPGLEVRAVDGRGLAAPAIGVLELLPGAHRLRANLEKPPRDDIVFYESNEVAFEANAGAEYRLDGETGKNGWSPRVAPAVEPLPVARDTAEPVCWLESLEGTVVASESRGLKTKRVTLQVDGEPAPRTWDYLARALAPPAGLMRSFASGWSLDGSLWGYDVGARAALRPGQRLRAYASLCEPTKLVEFLLPNGLQKSSR